MSTERKFDFFFSASKQKPQKKTCKTKLKTAQELKTINAKCSNENPCGEMASWLPSKDSSRVRFPSGVKNLILSFFHLIEMMGNLLRNNVLLFFLGCLAQETCASESTPCMNAEERSNRAIVLLRARAEHCAFFPKLKKKRFCRPKVKTPGELLVAELMISMQD